MTDITNKKPSMEAVVTHISHRLDNVNETFRENDHHLLAEFFQQAPAFMALLTGPEHRIDFVNPGYLKLTGHRDILGKSVAEGLPDAASQGYVALLDEVYLSGIPYADNSAKYTMQAVPGGPVGDRYVDFVFQPVRSADRKVKGIFVQGIDVTDRVRADKRRDALGFLTDAMRDLKTPEEVIYKASEILGQALGVSRVGYGTIDHEAETLTVDRDWNAAGVESLAGTLKLRDYGSFIDDLKLGKFIAIYDVDTDHRTKDAAAALKGRSAGSFVNFPILEQGRLVAVIFVNHATARDWTPDDLALIKELAERTRTASERLRNAASMQQSEAKFRTITDAMPQMVWSALPDGYLDYFNQRWYDFTGIIRGQTDEQDWHHLLHPDDQEPASASWHHIFTRGEVYEIQYRLRHYSGDYRWVLGRALPVHDDKGCITRWMGTFTDIHDQKLAEEELRQASQRKDEFLAMLAHELRNPLAPISTAAQLLKLQTLDEARVHRASDIITRQVKHMTALIDDLLDVSRVTRGLVQLNKENFDLKTVIHNAVEQTRPLIEARHHALLLRIPSEHTHVNGDKTRLVQAITNLLNNAAKYTPQRGQIELKMEVHGTQLDISVIDNGSGIAPELLPYIFDLFTQAERTPDRAQGGLGLGLALVRSICNLHGWRVSAHSQGLGKGSRFTISLPLVSPDAIQSPAVPDAKTISESKAIRLLIVDDNEDAAISLAAILESQGHHVMVAADAKNAFDIVAKEDIQVFILDIGLPDMDGYELARQLRANTGTKDLLLIALTGYGQAHDRVLSKTAGFDHHFVKPMDIAQLSEILANFS